VSADPKEVSALSVGGIRRGIYMIVLAILQSGVVGTWIAKKTGFSTRLVSIDDLQAVFLLLTAVYSALVGAYVGVQNIIRRIQVGNDPTNPAPPVKVPDFMNATAARLSR
jgi:hypothetical protein